LPQLLRARGAAIVYRNFKSGTQQALRHAGSHNSETAKANMRHFVKLTSNVCDRCGATSGAENKIIKDAITGNVLPAKRFSRPIRLEASCASRRERRAGGRHFRSVPQDG